MQRPFPLIAVGVALVALDFRTEVMDFLPDPLGWGLVAAGAVALGIRRPALGAGLAAVLSLADVHLPYRYVLIDPMTAKAVDRCPSDLPLGVSCPERLQFDPVTGWRLVVVALALAAGAAAVVGLALALRREAAATGDGHGSQRMGLLALAIGVGWVLPQALAIGWSVGQRDGEYDVVWNGQAEYGALLGVLALGWLTVELARHSGRRWAIPAAAQQASRWELRR